MKKKYSVFVFDSRNTGRSIYIGAYPVSIARDMARATAQGENAVKYIVQTKEMGGWFECYERKALGLASADGFTSFSAWEKTEWSA